MVKQIAFQDFINLEIKNMVEIKFISHSRVENFKHHFSLALSMTIKVLYFPIMQVYLSESQDLIVSVKVIKKFFEWVFDWLVFLITYSMNFTIY